MYKSRKGAEFHVYIESVSKRNNPISMMEIFLNRTCAAEAAYQNHR